MSGPIEATCPPFWWSTPPGRSPVDDWLARIGARPTATWFAECGIAYYSRHYRVRPAVDLPGLPVTRTVIALDEFLAGKWGADNGAVQLVVAPLAADRRFRTVRDPGIFTAVLRTVPAYAAWLDVMDPITDVFPMGGLHNTLRRLVVDGTPVATGLLAIGDSVCTTNPTLGRGLALALTGAADLADTLGEHAGDPAAQALALDRLVAAHVAPFYQDQAAIDAARLAMMRHTIFGEPAPRPPADADRVSYPQLRVAGCYNRSPSARSGRSTAWSARPRRSTPTRTWSRARGRRSAGTAAARRWPSPPASSCSPPSQPEFSSWDPLTRHQRGLMIKQ